MHLTKFGGVRLPNIDEQVAFPTDMRSGLIPLQNGSFDEHGQPTILQPFRITREFKVACDDSNIDLGGSIDELMRVFASGRKMLECLWRDGTKRHTFAKVVNAVRPRLSDDRNYQQFTVVWEIDFPYWIDTEQEPHYLDHGLYLDSGLYLDGNYTTLLLNETTETFSIENNGTVQNRRGFLYIYPSVGGSFTDLTLTNAANNYSLTLAGTVVDGERLLVDFLSKSVKLDSVDAYGMLELPVGQMDWMVLELGDNDFTVALATVVGNTTFEYHWADLYL